MSQFGLSKRSYTALEGVHPRLVEVVELAIARSAVDFVVIEGLRTRIRQAELLRAGATTTLNSRHITGHAVDLAAWVATGPGKGEIRWDWPLYYKIAAAMKSAATELGVQMVWGGDWKTFKDGPHYELDRSVYK